MEQFESSKVAALRGMNPNAPSSPPVRMPRVADLKLKTVIVYCTLRNIWVPIRFDKIYEKQKFFVINRMTGGLGKKLCENAVAEILNKFISHS